ncbi:MAG: protoglobin family protein [Planctomycetales bacterium]|nr:protoglobin family protein [Planctomycetales bacterium]
MKHIDEEQLESDVVARYAYLAEFIGFSDEDVAVIHASVARLAPIAPQLVDKTYEKLLSYDATARHFVPRQHGYAGPLPASVDELSANHAQIKFRKEHLSRYLMSLLGRAYDAKMVSYLDMVGKMHTPKAGNKDIDVPLVQMNALMGLIADVLTEAIAGLDLERDAMLKTIRAFHKLLWIQNDLINRHYQAEAVLA